MRKCVAIGTSGDKVVEKQGAQVRFWPWSMEEKDSTRLQLMQRIRISAEFSCIEMGAESSECMLRQIRTFDTAATGVLCIQMERERNKRVDRGEAGGFLAGCCCSLSYMQVDTVFYKASLYTINIRFMMYALLICSLVYSLLVKGPPPKTLIKRSFLRNLLIGSSY